MIHILIIDDDVKLTSLIKEYLENHTFKVSVQNYPEKGLRFFEKSSSKIDLIILDITMPIMDGFQVLRKIRGTSTVPIIMLTARGEVSDRVVGLELGADDYLPKPFEPKELLLRIINILKKTHSVALPDEILIGKVLINLKKLHIKINNQVKKINLQEKKVLEKMIKSPGKVFSRNDIGKIINISKERTIDVMITRLRQKIESYPKNPKYLQTIRGSGYVLWIK